jgi:predicted transcriptional regulator
VQATSIIENRIDLQRALAGLSSTDISLCSELIDFTPTEISKKAGRSRAGVYRAIKNIRMHMIRSGILIVA